MKRILLLFIASILTISAIEAKPKQMKEWKQGVLDIHHISTGRGQAIFFLMPDGNGRSAKLVSARIDSLRCQNQHTHGSFNNLLRIADTINEILFLIDDRSHQLRLINLSISHLKEMDVLSEYFVHDLICIINISDCGNRKRSMMCSHQNRL